MYVEGFDIDIFQSYYSLIFNLVNIKSVTMVEQFQSYYSLIFNPTFLETVSDSQISILL